MSLCGFTIRGRLKEAPFACPECGSKKWRIEGTMTAEAAPSCISNADHEAGVRPVIQHFDLYAVSLRCKRGHQLSGSGYVDKLRSGQGPSGSGAVIDRALRDGRKVTRGDGTEIQLGEPHTL